MSKQKLPEGELESGAVNKGVNGFPETSYTPTTKQLIITGSITAIVIIAILIKVIFFS